MTRRTRPPFLSLKLPFFWGGSLLGIFGILFPMQYIERLAQKAPAKEAEEVQWVFAFGFLVEVIFCQHVVTFFYCITLIFLCFLQDSKKIFSQIFFFIFSTEVPAPKRAVNMSPSLNTVRCSRCERDGADIHHSKWYCPILSKAQEKTKEHV